MNPFKAKEHETHQPCSSDRPFLKWSGVPYKGLTDAVEGQKEALGVIA